MSSAFGRKAQIVIDYVRGKKRLQNAADAFAQAPDIARRRAELTGELEKLFYAHEGRIAHKWHHYLEIYERHFSRLRSSGHPVRILELGVAGGGSLQLWHKYFGPSARIVGIDINPACAQNTDAGSTIIIGDQSDPAVLASAVATLGGLDIVIDDGSHVGQHQIASFEYLYPRLSDTGFYACEDLHSGYWGEFGGGLQRPGTFIEYAKGLIDQLHAWYMEDDDKKAAAMPFAQRTFALHVYATLVVIEKRPISAPYHVRIGKA